MASERLVDRKALRAIIVEDSPDDYEILHRELIKLGYDCVSVRVESRAELAAALAEPWDIVFSDWTLPQFSAPDALAAVRATGRDIPFIIVSGTIGEDTAVQALRDGAHDFLVKGKLARLGVAVERELREAAARVERVKIQEHLAISDRMASVGVLAAGVAHEINNPLSVVLNNLEIALSELDGMGSAFSACPLRDELDDAVVAANRVRLIVRDLRTFVRTDDDQVEAVEVQTAMESTLRLASNEIKRRARLVKDYQEAPYVMASEGRLGQVFLNLLVNAAQAIPDGSSAEHIVTVTIRATATHARISVTDTGSGIDPAVRKRLFEPFVTTKPIGIGTGLGLSICHRIVTAIGGSIEVDSQVGRGTTFTVVLPRVA